MGATSVTGKGLGSADGKNKGSEHQTLGVAHLIGPRVVYAGRITLSGTTGTIVHPTLAGVVGDYCVLLTAESATSPFITSRTTGSIGIQAGSNAVVHWAILKVGL